VGLGFGFAAAASTAHATALPSTAVTVDGSRSGPVFDGVGAISGGGGNSRYLIDYPAAQRDAILDYLFKPNYGAALQVLKLEIGGDANSTDGAEQSAEHSHGQINCGTGYEWWMAEQAVARNPAIKLAGLQWAAPGWVADSYGGIWSSADRGYLIDWLGCAKQHGLAISYIGGWNERYNPQTAPGGSKRCGPRLTQTATAAFRSSRLIRTPSAAQAALSRAAASARRPPTTPALRGAWRTRWQPTQPSRRQWPSSVRTTPAATRRRGTPAAQPQRRGAWGSHCGSLSSVR